MQAFTHTAKEISLPLRGEDVRTREEYIDFPELDDRLNWASRGLYSHLTHQVSSSIYDQG